MNLGRNTGLEFPAMTHKRIGSWQLRALWHWIASLPCLLLIIGCGSGMASVSGSVTLDGAQLAGGKEVRGTVFFYPDGQPGAPGIGVLDENGRYTLMTGSQEGVKPGPYTVAVSATQIIMPKDPHGMPSGKPITPRKYGDPKLSGFHADVQSGSNTFDFALNSKSAQ